MKKIKQYGCQRSGTNLTKYLLEHYYEIKVSVNIGGWKHGDYKKQNPEVPIVITTKDPYAWLFSIYKYSMSVSKKKVTFEKFLHRRYSFEKQDAENPVQHWNNMHNHWLVVELKDNPLCVVRYESLIADPNKETGRIAKKIGAKKKSSLKVELPKRVLLPGDDRRTNFSGTTNFIPSHYTDRQYMVKYTDEMTEFVAKELDNELIHRLGYQQ